VDGASLERESEQVRTTDRDRRMTDPSPAGIELPRYPDGPKAGPKRHGSKAAGERMAHAQPEGAPLEVEYS
jgi:hypothetical protein